jgi:hypothetical protein
MKLNKLTLACLALGSGLLLSACGGGDSPATVVATNNAVAAFNPANGPAIAAAVTGKKFEFSTPVVLQDSTNTAVSVNSVQLGGTRAVPTFDMATTIAGVSTPLAGNLTFASCIFTVPVQPTAPARTITVNPCAITFVTAGLAANGNNVTANATLTLGTRVSQTVPITLSISPNGTVSVGDIALPVSVAIGTGTGS